MILPWLSRSIRSMGWMIRQRMRTTSPALIVEGNRSRTLPISDMSSPGGWGAPGAPSLQALVASGGTRAAFDTPTGLAAAAADGDLHLALHLKESPVALLHDGPDVAGLPQADVLAHVGLPGLGSERDPGHHGDPVLVGHDVDVLHIAGRRHGRVDLDRHGHHGSVLGDERDLELDQGTSILERARPEEALQGRLDAFLLAEGLGSSGPGRHHDSRRGGHAERAQGAERRTPGHPRPAERFAIIAHPASSWGRCRATIPGSDHRHNSDRRNDDRLLVPGRGTYPSL